MNKQKVAVIGYGSFGALLVGLLAQQHEVLVYEKNDISKNDLPESAKQITEIKDIKDCSAIFIATGLDSLRLVCESIKPFITKDMIVADVCSVKVEPAKTMHDVLGDSCQLLATHPLFGPQTVLKFEDARGQKMVWHELSDGDFHNVRSIFEDTYGIEIVELKPEEHDKEMAWVHGLTFFTGRALLDMQPPSSTLGTNYYQKLIDLVAVEQQHSEELFMTIQRGNPYTDEIRQRFMDTLQKYENKIKDES